MNRFRFQSASELVHAIVEMLQREIEKGGCRVVEDIGKVPPSLFHVNKLYTVVLNLLVNARMRARQGGSIFVKVRAEEKFVDLDVAYEGEPMDPAIIAEILETVDPDHVYLRGPETPRDFPFRVTSSMIKDMGGSISTSPVEGGGTRVSVKLPFIKDRRKVQKPVKHDRRKKDAHT